MSDYMKQYEEDFGFHCYNYEEIMEKIVEVANRKVEHLYNGLKKLKNIEVYSFNISNQEAPQTALKLYKINSNYYETEKILSGILEVSIDKLNSIFEFCFYEVRKASESTYAQLVNEGWNSKDESLKLIYKDDFNTKEIDSLIDKIHNVYS